MFLLDAQIPQEAVRNCLHLCKIATTGLKNLTPPLTFVCDLQHKLFTCTVRKLYYGVVIINTIKHYSKNLAYLQKFI